MLQAIFGLLLTTAQLNGIMWLSNQSRRDAYPAAISKGTMKPANLWEYWVSGDDAQLCCTLRLMHRPQQSSTECQNVKVWTKAAWLQQSTGGGHTAEAEDKLAACQAGAALTCEVAETLTWYF